MHDRVTFRRQDRGRDFRGLPFRMVAATDSSHALVLDLAFQPVAVIPWKRAMVLDLLDRAEVLEYFDVFVRSASSEHALPAVLRLYRYVPVRQRVPALTRELLLVRDRFACQYCGAEPGASKLTLDHVVPRSRGGVRSWQNIVAACAKCNRSKGSRTPDEAGMRLSCAPRVPEGLVGANAMVQVDRMPEEWKLYLR
jgi:5-methylcytosine-specific restriction endonuclease McrA